MKARFWVKFVLGLAAILLLIAAGVYLVEYFIDTMTNFLGGGEIPDDGSGDYAIVTPEPYPTMPAYMREDSFYDNADSVDGE